MLRFTLLLAVGLLAGLLPARANAQPTLSGNFRVIEAKADNGKLTWTEIKLVPSTREEERVVVINGMNVKQKVAVTVFVPVQEAHAIELKKLKASNGAGKALDADKLAELLKETKPVVIVSGSLTEKHRKLFKDTTVFLEMPASPVLPPKQLPPPPPPPVKP